MTSLSVILPVFFMLGLGYLSRLRSWVNASQTQAISVVLNRILFPMMVFNAMFTADFHASALGVILFFLTLHLLALGLGKVLAKPMSGPYASVSRFLLGTVDGGNVCYPLYASLVGSQFIGNIVLMDIAGIFIIFLLIPVLVAGDEAGSWRERLRQLSTNPVILTLMLGLFLNFVGLPALMEKWHLNLVYTSLINMATAPIIPLILWTIGYQFKVDRRILVPLLKTLAVRILFMGLGLIVFLTLFSELRADRPFYLAALLYFMSPPALVMPNLIQKAMTSEGDKNFVSAFTSVYMLVTLVVFMAMTLMV